MTKQTCLYKSGPITVTNSMLRFRHRRYAIRNIENLVLQRPLFLMGAGIATMCLGFLWFNTDILYMSEMLVLLVFATLLPAISWPWGTLHIQSKLLKTNEGTITWWHSDLSRVQDVVENLLDARMQASATIVEETEDEAFYILDE